MKIKNQAKLKHSSARLQKCMSFCTDCNTFAHSVQPLNSKWHSIEGLDGSLVLKFCI